MNLTANKVEKKKIVFITFGGVFNNKRNNSWGFWFEFKIFICARETNIPSTFYAFAFNCQHVYIENVNWFGKKKYSIKNYISKVVSFVLYTLQWNENRLKSWI